MNQTNFLAEEKISKLMLKFSIPCIASLLVSSLYNIVDQIFIGRGVGYLGNGATNVVFPITIISLAIALMIGDGAAANLSLSMGSKKTEEAKASVGTAITLSLVSGILLMALFFLMSETILATFGATENNIEYAREYFRVIAIGIPFYVFTASMNALIRADGSPQFAMFSTLIGCVINCILDPIAIFGLHWGMFGAALATIVGQIVTAILAAWYLFHLKSVKLSLRDLFSGFYVVKRYIPLGFSSFLTQVAIVVTMGVMNNVLVFYGAQTEYGPDIPLTVFGIVMKVFQIVIAFCIGIAAGAQPIVGFNCGAKRFDRVKELYRKMLVAEIVLGFIAMAFFELFPVQIISLFGGESDLYNKFAALSFRIYLSTIAFCCVQKATSVFLQSVGKTAQSFILSLVRDIVVMLAVALVLPRYIGLNGALLVAPIADVVSMAFVVVFMRKTLREWDV